MTIFTIFLICLLWYVHEMGGLYGLMYGKNGKNDPRKVEQLRRDKEYEKMSNYQTPTQEEGNETYTESYVEDDFHTQFEEESINGIEEEEDETEDEYGYPKEESFSQKEEVNEEVGKTTEGIPHNFSFSEDVVYTSKDESDEDFLDDGKISVVSAEDIEEEYVESEEEREGKQKQLDEIKERITKESKKGDKEEYSLKEMRYPRDTNRNRVARNFNFEEGIEDVEDNTEDEVGYEDIVVSSDDEVKQTEVEVYEPTPIEEDEVKGDKEESTNKSEEDEEYSTQKEEIKEEVEIEDIAEKEKGEEYDVEDEEGDFEGIKVKNT